MLDNFLHHVGHNKYPKNLVLVWYKGSLFGFTPFRSDFIDCVKCDIIVKGVKKLNQFIGIGTTLHNFVDSRGKYFFLLCV